jgi:AcrR family transcriptional regulator
MNPLPDPKEMRRKEIIQAAISLFGQKGYDRTSVSDIVKAVGIAQGTFYLYFQNKEALLAAVLHEFVEGIKAEILPELLQEPSPLRRIERGIQRFVELFLHHEEIIGSIHTGGAMAHHDARVTEAYARFTGLVRAWIEEGIEKGEIEPQNPEITAYFIVLLVGEVTHNCFLREYPAKLDLVIPELIRFVRLALRARSTE